MKKLLLVLLVLTITSCECGKSKEVLKDAPSVNTSNITLGKYSSSETMDYVIKDNVLIIDDVFTIKSKQSDDGTDIVYTLYHNNVYTDFYNFHSNLTQSNNPMTYLVKDLIDRYKLKQINKKVAFDF